MTIKNQKENITTGLNMKDDFDFPGENDFDDSGDKYFEEEPYQNIISNGRNTPYIEIVNLKNCDIDPK